MKERIGAQDHSSIESPEAHEARRRRWARLRNFALAASLLVNGGIIGDKLTDKWTAHEVSSSSKSEEGFRFAIGSEDGREKSEFVINNRGEGVNILEGVFSRGGNEYKVVFRLPANVELQTQVHEMQASGDPVEIVRRMIDSAEFGEIKMLSSNGRPIYEATFGNDEGRAAIQASETFYDEAGNLIGSNKTSLGSLEKSSFAGTDPEGRTSPRRIPLK